MPYPPREDSLLLERQVLKLARGLVLDIGTGSGIQAKAAASRGLKVLASDIDPTCATQGIEFVQSDLFANIRGKFDTIVFNPPYLPDAEPRDIALDGGPTGRELLDRFLSGAKAYLSPGGQLIFVQSSLTGVEKTKQTLLELGYAWEIVSRQRVFFEELVVFRAWLM